MKYFTTIILITFLNVTAMAYEIKTEVIIDASPQKIWSILIDFENYPNWNPFIKSIAGIPKVGNKITVRVEPPESKGMTFNPKILTFDFLKKLTWLGHFMFNGLFDGKHTFEIIDNGNGTSTFKQSETFSGVLVPFFKKKLLKTKKGFELMNNKLKELAEK